MPALQRLTGDRVDALLAWYGKNKRDFPWRRDPNPYWVWLAEIMSQQTVMAALVPYFHRFIEKFPSVDQLARASEDEVLAAWTGLGYYSRARNVHKTSKILAERGFPRSAAEWLELPGVGPYTAAAIASQCFGESVPVWDGNVTRVCSRLDARSDAHSSAFRVEMTETLARRMGGRDASAFNQAMMELGATVCTPRSPACGVCPLAGACAARARGEAEAFPPPKPRKAAVELKCRVWVCVRQGKLGAEVYLERRSDENWFPGMWDFLSELGGASSPVRDVRHAPSGKAESIGAVRHQITHHRISLDGLLAGAPRKTGEGRWIPLEALTAENPPVPLATTARKVLRAALRKRLLTL
jgi:A/G-specific adenine glycosylase